MSIYNSNIDGMILATTTITASLVLLLSLCHCFFGYILFRINLLIDGLLVGLWLGAAIITFKKADASGLDIFVASGVCGVLLAILAWNFYRLLFAVGAAGAVYVAVCGVFGLPASTGGIILGIIAALIMLAYAYANAKKLVVYITGIAGAAAFSLAVMAIWAGRPVHPYAITGEQLPMLFTGIIIAVILAALGILVQKHTMYLFSPKFSPEGQRQKRRQAGDIKLRIVR
ncbi:MAG TPA: hypothetical protein PKK48_10020 [Phycisphaerae bacterium]|nr:hypothetical protein [Phycisphaerae bacterium]